MQLEELRARKQLKPIAKEAEGAPLGGLSGQIYGFTYSPVNDSTPLFAQKTKQAFEVHKLAEGDVHIIGFVTAAEAETFLAGREAMDIKLYPEPYGDANSLIELPVERLVRAKPLSRSDGNYMPVQIDPAI